MKDHRPPLYLLTGILIGVLTGLFISYVLLPVRYANTTPDLLSAGQKEIYRALVGRAYLYEADTGRAFSRLALLQDADLNAVLVAGSQQEAASGGDALSAHGLALLAADVGQPGQVITPLITAAINQPTATAEPSQATMAQATLESTPTRTPKPTKTPLTVSKTPVIATETPFVTFTPRPSNTPQPTQGAPYVLVSQSGDCAKNDRGSLLIVNVFDSAGNGMPGVKVEISLPNGGSEDFYTGLYPEINDGYADYTMDPAATYSLRVGLGGALTTGLQLPQCMTSDGKAYSVDLVLTYKQQ
jgi:hypothetical protein